VKDPAHKEINARATEVVFVGFQLFFLPRTPEVFASEETTKRMSNSWKRRRKTKNKTTLGHLLAGQLLKTT